MKNIIIYGSGGCFKCKKLKNLIENIITENNLDAEITYCDDIDQIINKNLMTMPVIEINGEVKAAGRIPSAKEIINWLKN